MVGMNIRGQWPSIKIAVNSNVENFMNVDIATSNLYNKERDDEICIKKLCIRIDVKFRARAKMVYVVCISMDRAEM